MRLIRYISCSIVLVLLVCAAGCGGSNGNGDDKSAATPSPALSTPTSMPTPEPEPEPVITPESTEPPAPTLPTFPTAGYCNGEGVNLRAEPNTNAAIVDIMGENTVLELLSLEDGWFKVKTGEQTAYVAEKLITVGAPPRKDNMHWAKIIAKEAQAYGAPTDEDILDIKLKKGEALKVLRKLGDYLHVVYNQNLQCYIHTSDAAFISEDEYNGGTPAPAAR